MEAIDEMSDSDSSSSRDLADDTYSQASTEGSSRATQMSHADRVRMYKLQRNMAQLDAYYRLQEHQVMKAREEVKICLEHIVELQQQRDKLENDIDVQRKEENMAALLRLRAEHRRLCMELNGVEEMEVHLTMTLREQEKGLNLLDLEIKHNTNLRQEVQRKQQELEMGQKEKAAHRLQQHTDIVRRAEKMVLLERRKQRAAEEENAARAKRQAEEAEASRQRVSVYLKQTMNRVHQEKASKQQQKQETMAKRMHAVLSLKSSIAAIQENMRSQQAQHTAYMAKEKEQEKQTKEMLRAEGKDVTRQFYQQQCLKEFNKKKEEFEEKQKSRRVGIVSKLLLEETLMEKRRKKTPLFGSPQKVVKQGLNPTETKERLLQYLDSVMEEKQEQEWCLSSYSKKNVEVDMSSVGESSSEEETEEQEESLAQPEFAGLWEPKQQKYKEPEEEPVPQAPQPCRTDGEALGLTTSTDTACKRKGKEIKRCPFVSKPQVVMFKDFDVGKTYKKKVTITNVAPSTTHCRLLGISENLKGFIMLHLDPPGHVFPGMSFDLMITFQPVINKELFGEVKFLSPAGQFTVPLKCTVRRCVMEVDKGLIDFGTHVVGQTISQAITLTNRGCLGTHFVLVSTGIPQPEQPVAEEETVVETSQIPSDAMDSDGVQDATSTQDERQTRESCSDMKNNNEDAQSTDNQEPAQCSPASELTPLLGDTSQDDTMQSSEITAGEVREGDIGPFSSVTLNIIFTPTLPGEVNVDFHLQFSDPCSPPIPISARGVAVSFPVWVLQPNIDMKICMYDRIYQDSIVVENRSNTTMQLLFGVCKELRNHMEILPKSAIIQTQSTFQAHLRFLPRSSLPKDAPQYFDSETGVLEAPLAIQVVGQVHSIPFAVHAVVTTSDLQFDQTSVDFGHCSVYESVQSSVFLTNLSLLPQDFGFVGVPKFVEIQPNEGFGTLLPLETLEIRLIFNAEKEEIYDFQLLCKSGINRKFRLSCRAVGVQPPLELTHSRVKFGRTAVGDTSSAVLCVVNRDTSIPRRFEFVIPEGAQINISPSTGRVLPEQKHLVQVSFRPTLSEETVKEEVVRMIAHAQHLKALEEERIQREAELAAMQLKSIKEGQSKSKKGKKKAPKPSSKNSSIAASQATSSASTFLLPCTSDIETGSDDYFAAQTCLLRSYPENISSVTIPCFVSDGETPEYENQSGLPYSPYNTLYLEVHSVATAPVMLLVSNNGQSVVDFHQVVVGQTQVQRATVENISKGVLHLSSSLLNLNGPFVLLNALRPLAPGATHTLLLAFSPDQHKQYQETLQVHCTEMSLTLTLRGNGILPSITCSHKENLLDFGYIVQKESASLGFTLTNSSPVEVQFSAYLDSQRWCGLPALPAGTQPIVGTQNFSGLCVFSVSPVHGAIPPGKTQNMSVTFSPDHESLHYTDRLTVELISKQTVCVLDLSGSALRTNMYLFGGDNKVLEVEPLSCLLEDTVKSAPLPVLLTFWASCNDEEVLPAERTLDIGCLRSAGSKKNMDFFWDSVPALQQQGFTVDPVRGNVPLGKMQTVTVTWAPPTDMNPYEEVHASALLTLKGDQTQVYSVTMLASPLGHQS